MNFEIIPAYTLPLTEQAEIVNQGFAKYVAGWTNLDAATLARFLLLQGSDMFYSRFVSVDGQLAGVGYITRTANICRLSAMAIVEPMRGSGAASFLLDHLLEDAGIRGDAAMMLEVIEQNPRACALYQRHQFHELTRLVGWRRHAVVEPHDSGQTLQEMPVIEAVQMRSPEEYPDIPWSISRHAITKAVGTRAFRRGGAAIVIADLPEAPIRVHGFFSETAGPQDFDESREILHALFGQFPSRAFFAPPVFPELCGRRLFEPLGFIREPISQFFMRRDL